MRELSQDAQVSLGLVQRVLDRLLREQLVSTSDSRGRTVSDAKALLKLWGQENNDLGQPFAKAYLYSPLDALKTICKVIPDICFGGALAANSYVSRLSTVPAPFKVWVPRASSSQGILQRIDGLEIVEEGANLEFYSVAGDHWRIHASEWEGALRVSSARSFVELYEAEGRLQELAQAVLDGFQ